MIDDHRDLDRFCEKNGWRFVTQVDIQAETGQGTVSVPEWTREKMFG